MIQYEVNLIQKVTYYNWRLKGNLGDQISTYITFLGPKKDCNLARLQVFWNTYAAKKSYGVLRSDWLVTCNLVWARLLSSPCQPLSTNSQGALDIVPASPAHQFTRGLNLQPPISLSVCPAFIRLPAPLLIRWHFLTIFFFVDKFQLVFNSWRLTSVQS